MCVRRDDGKGKKGEVLSREGEKRLNTVIFRTPQERPTRMALISKPHHGVWNLVVV
jgi:hypothetical protein